MSSGLEPDGQRPVPSPVSPFEEPPSLFKRIKRLLVGSPRDFYDRSVFHAMALAPLLAWVGLGADGLSSSSYGPEEAFKTMGAHTYLAVGMAFMTALTIAIISMAYSHIIEEFPHGGGGYVVGTKLLGDRVGLTSGCALLVDYVLTITMSVAVACDSLFSFLPHWMGLFRYETEFALIIGLVILNMRGVKESVTILAPIFMAFLVLHVILICGGIFMKMPEIPAVVHETTAGFSEGVKTLGYGGMFLLFAHAFSLGGGTYTGLEAVSNGLPIMQEPRVRTAKRTMLYMAVSLAFTAGGLLLCYLLWHVNKDGDKTLNCTLTEKFVSGMPFGHAFVIITMISEGALLVVAAQAGFIDGPRVLANMAVDGWAPRRFAALSQRLTTENGILLMGVASIAALIYTHGDANRLVVLYSINVFLTFSLSMFAMGKMWWSRRKTHKEWKSRLALFLVGFALCVTILAITTVMKFSEGGWVTLLVTGSLVGVFMMVRRHYQLVGVKLREVFAQLEDLPITPPKEKVGEVDPKQSCAVILVGGYSGIGIHTTMRVIRHFPGQFKSMVFLSVGVIDSGEFKGEGAVEALRDRTQKSLDRYVELAQKLGFPATSRVALGTDATEEAANLSITVGQEFPNAIFFAGKLVFQREKWYQRFLHNETAVDLQKRINEAGRVMVVMPAKV
ncbi:TPA: amino acid transporter [Candidatus Sumerlaeota bacterium]|nr:amino acid transporter [Candidatus Sumerlaeota bacterium]